MAPKVSVVVPTYAPGDRIDGLVRSLDAQTLPSSEFEIVYVDDGSPDDTWRRLKRIRAARDNVRIERIENSGWPSRPRNVGLGLATGEYVLFMDHDDELYPRALEAGYAMAARTHADVLNGKETRTDQSKWALDTYLANVDNAVNRTDVHPLIPTNPHKLFRREFLLEHDIRFPEGRRVLWEDVFFALDVAKHAQVVSVLADTPFYHWVRKGSTASSSYTKDLHEFWHWVREIVVRTNATLTGPELHEQWRLMLLHQYRSRVLAPLAAIFSAPADEAEFARATVDEIVHDLVPVELDRYLTPTQRGRADLVRARRWDLLAEYVKVDSGLVGVSEATSVQWRDGGLDVTAEARWHVSGNKPLALVRDGDRLRRDLPAHVAAHVSDEALDMTDAVQQARSRLSIRSRETAVSWLLPTETEIQVRDVDGRPTPVAVASGRLDPATAAFGAPLPDPSWDVTARNELVGTINQRNLRSRVPARSAVVGGRVLVAYRNKQGMLSFDADETNRSLVGSAPPDESRATARSASGSAAPTGLARLVGPRTQSVRVEIPFRDVVGDGSTVPARVELSGRPHDAVIEARDDTAWLVLTVTERTGAHPITLRTNGVTRDTGLDLVLDRHGASVRRRRQA